jgi:hypothetical protein
MRENRDFRGGNHGGPSNGNGPNYNGNLIRAGIRTDAGTIGGQPLNPSGAPDGENKQPVTASSFAARFGRAIVQHGIAAIPSALFHYQGSLDMSAQEVWFTSYVMCFKWDENLPRVNLSQMEKRVGMGKRSLYRLKDRLCEADYLRVFPVYTENGRQDCSAYDFSGLFEQIERLILADPPKANPIHTDDPDVSDSDDGEEPADHDMSFLARFGRVIARYGVAAVPQAVFTYQAALDLKPQQVWFIAYIFSYQWKKALPYPSIVKMSARTGYSTVQLHEIKASLVDLGYLRLVPRSTRYGGRDSNAYDFSGLFDAIRAQLQRDHAQGKGVARQNTLPTPQPAARPRPSRRRGRTAAQHPALMRSENQGDSELSYQGDSKLIWEDDSRLSGESGSERIWKSDPQFLEESDTYLIEDDDSELTEESGLQLTTYTNPTPPTRVTLGLRKRVTPSLHNIESIQEEKKRKDDSNHLSQKRASLRKPISTVSPPSSQYIIAVMDDFSNELDDPDHKLSNATQALRLWQASGLSEQEFIQLVYEAKQLTRKYQGKNGLRGIENKMAYFFIVLRDLCGLGVHADAQSNTEGSPQERQPAQPTPTTGPGTDGSPTIGARQLWQAALTELQISIPEQSFLTWLKSTSISRIEDHTVVIAVPSNFAKDWLERRYSRQIAETLHGVIGYKVDVRFEVRTHGQLPGLTDHLEQTHPGIGSKGRKQPG